MSSGKKEVKQALKLRQQGLFKQEKDALEQEYTSVYNSLTPATTVSATPPPVTVPVPDKKDHKKVLEYVSNQIKELEQAADPKGHKQILELNKKQKFLESYNEFQEKYEALGNDEDFFEFLEISGIDFKSAEYTFGNGEKRKIDKPGNATSAGPSARLSDGSDKWRIGMPLSASSVSIQLSEGQTLTVFKDKTIKFSMSDNTDENASPFVDIVLNNFKSKYDEWKRNPKGNAPSLSYSLDKVKDPERLRKYLIKATIYRYTHQSTDKLAAYSEIVDALVRGGQLTYEEIDKLKLGYRDVNPKIPYRNEKQFLDHYNNLDSFGKVVKADIASRGINAFLGGTPRNSNESNVCQLLTNLFAKVKKGEGLDQQPEYKILRDKYVTTKYSIEDALANKAGLEYQKCNITEKQFDDILTKFGSIKPAEIKNLYPPAPSSPSLSP